MSTHLHTRRDAAAYLRVSTAILDRLTAAGGLRRIKFGRTVRYRQTDLDAFLDEQAA